uniref:Defensin-B3 n=1 Tax=Ornithorhynchus anatinus TaxID=9258 RepID=DEFB3_ORNAN|nr:RecName: Full=Defensin-B3; Short=DefB3; Short=OaDefB3; Flags: Precursor [Ornithorhynchus anatinus]
MRLLLVFFFLSLLDQAPPARSGISRVRICREKGGHCDADCHLEERHLGGCRAAYLTFCCRKESPR